MKKYNATILLVDHDADFLIFVERAFRQNGVTSPIHQVHDGAEAIAYMMGEGRFSDPKVYEYPTFVMTDLKMPRADGFAVLQHLKGNPEWTIIPTVVFSSSSDLDDIKKFYMLGAEVMRSGRARDIIPTAQRAFTPMAIVPFWHYYGRSRAA